MAVQVKTETITPTKAKKWLENKNKDNRRLRKGIVSAYARDIKNGSWEFTGDAIRFNGDGTLIDGQHRLAAVVSANKPIKSLVIRGLESKSKFVFDTGAKRNLADVLHYKGYSCTALLGASIRWCVQYERESLSAYTSGSRLVSTSEALSWIEKNKRIADLAKLVNGTAFPYGSVNCAIIAIMYYDKTGEARGFYEQLVKGEGLHKGHPVYELRRWLEWAYVRETRLRTTRVIQAITIKAWNAYIAGENIKSLRFIAGGLQPEEFPRITVTR